MKQRLKNQNGTTLVELIVCMVLLSLFTLAAVTLIQPSAQAYMDIQQQTRAQNLADALIETIRGEVLEANGYIRFTDGATIPNDTDEDNGYDSIFKEKTGVSDGTALEFSVYPNHIELIDKDYVPPLTKSDGTQLLKQKQANALNGYLHMRFYRDELNDAGHYGNPQHTKKDKAEDGTETVTRPYVAYGYTTAYPPGCLYGAVHQRTAFLRPQLDTGRRRNQDPAHYGYDGGADCGQAGRQQPDRATVHPKSHCAAAR